MAPTLIGSKAALRSVARGYKMTIDATTSTSQVTMRSGREST
jgi:hypothetical protein